MREFIEGVGYHSGSHLWVSTTSSNGIVAGSTVTGLLNRLLFHYCQRVGSAWANWGVKVLL